MLVLTSVTHVLHLCRADLFISDLTLILNNMLMEGRIPVSSPKFLGSLPALEVFPFSPINLLRSAPVLLLSKIALLHVKNNDLISIRPLLTRAWVGISFSRMKVAIILAVSLSITPVVCLTLHNNDVVREVN